MSGKIVLNKNVQIDDTYAMILKGNDNQLDFLTLNYKCIVQIRHILLLPNNVNSAEILLYKEWKGIDICFVHTRFASSAIGL